MISIQLPNLFRAATATRDRPFIPGDDLPSKWNWKFSDARLEFRTPHHSDVDWSSEVAQEPINLYDRSVYSGAAPPVSLLLFRRLFAAGFAVRGVPFLEGKFGSVHAVVNVETFDEHPQTLNLFNPSHFEYTIRKQLYYSCGPGATGFQAIAPLDWHIRSYGELQFICYDSARLDAELSADVVQGDTCCHLAISDRHFLTFNFFRSGMPYTYACDRAARSVIDRILRSVCLELSPSSAAKLAEARERWPDAQYSSHRDPEPWVFEERKLPDWDMDEYPTEILDEHYIVTRKASQPPVYDE